MKIGKLAKMGVVWMALLATGAWGQVNVRVATYNIEQFDGDQPQFDAAVDVLLRIGADVVCVEEMTDFTAFEDLALAAGYPYYILASTSGAIDDTLRTGVMSIHPIISSFTATSVGLSGDASANDLTRNFIVATIDVPGASDHLVLSGNHWKSADGDDNEFRRSVESIRAMQSIADLNGTVMPVIILGDMNDDLLDSPDSPTQFFSVPGGVPVSFELGNDITFPVNNGVFLPLLAGAGSSNLTSVNPLQLDGSDATYISGRRLDYLWYTDAVTVVGSEVYDSDDEDLPGGLPKNGSPLPAQTSADASDHFLVFADVEIESGDPLGACCAMDGQCTDGLTETDCTGLGGAFQGNGSECAGFECPQPPLVLTINEIRIDQPSTDNDEYFELSGPPGDSLTGMTYLSIGDGTGGSGVIEAVVSLTGLTIPADGYLLVAESTFTLDGATPDAVKTLDFENDDNVTHLLVSGFTGVNGQDLDTNNDGTLDLTPWTSIIDLIAVIEEENPPSSTEYHYGPPTVGPNGDFVPGHVFRCPNGSGTWEIGTFDPVGGEDTPGVANSCPAVVGACCTDGNCTETTIADCFSNGGNYQGDGSTCADTECPLSCTTSADAELPPLNTKVLICGAVISSTTDLVSDGAFKNFHIQDATGGVAVFGDNAAIDAILALAGEGDQIDVVGQTDSFSGLFELSEPLSVDNVASVGVPMPAPTTVADYQDLSATAETLESRLAIVHGVVFFDGDSIVQFNGLTNYNVSSDGGTTVAVVRIATNDLDLVGQVIPTGLVNVTGIFSQFDSSSPFDSGYQLLPRKLADIEVIPTGACCTGELCTGGVTEGDCTGGGGTYQGDDSVCEAGAPTCAPTTCEAWCCDGDANGDCAVDPLDSGYILARLGADPCVEGCAADVNCDGEIDPLDDGYAKARFNSCDPVLPCAVSCP